MRLAALALCGCLLIPAAASASFTFTTVADTNTPRPDGLGNFDLWYPFPPSLDGTTALLQDISANSCGGDDSLWAAPSKGGKYQRLVAIGDKAPGGTGTFTDLASPYGATAENGTVIFESQDSAGEGVYTVPLTGGKPSLVINYKHDFPDGSQFFIGAGTCEYTMNGISTDGKRVAIGAGNGDRLLVADVGSKRVTESVNTAYSNGYPLSPNVQAGAQLIDPPDNCSIFGGIGAPSDGPEISGKDLVFAGGGSGAGGNTTGLYRTPWDGFDAGSYNCSGPTEFVPPYLSYYGTALPGDPNGPGNNWVGPLSLDAGTVAYVMGDWTDNYQCVIQQKASGKGFRAVACGNKLLPGLTTLPVFFLSVAQRDGLLAFVAEDSAANDNFGLYVFDGKKVRKVIASGDALDSGTVVARWQWPGIEIGPRSVSGRSIAFFATVVRQDGSTPSGNFVATEK